MISLLQPVRGRTNKKWPHTAPKGKTLLRAYVGKAGDESIVEQSDHQIVSIVLEDLKKSWILKQIQN
ncbi:hypothetical protein BsIDN1_18820 [Bacillus safensis]|uniref:Amine oxidase domain-containing protein n=1 Tax=Bacillus safensis TaxID=561879 RepID=A0A5S9M7X6_BACIA|nr:hypothetical protein BsIDN1_18820 [Bacillus safensis]